MSSVINLRGRKPQVVDEKTEVYIGRAQYMGGWALEKSPWANPFGPSHGSREHIVAKYEKYIRGKPEMMRRLPELIGKKLCCWCTPELCHGNVLLKLLSEQDITKGNVR